MKYIPVMLSLGLGLGLVKLGLGLSLGSVKLNSSALQNVNLYYRKN